MPTMPASPFKAHEQRQVAESFGEDPDTYDRARPRYPEEMINRIVGASPGTDFLAAGCGTGIDARQFQRAGMTVFGVDPDERMAAFARQRGLDVEVGRFETWDAGGRRFDAVVAGQSWHWVDPVAGAAKAAEILRPGGRLAIFWNAIVPPAELSKAYGGVYKKLVPSLPAAAAAMSGDNPYGPLVDLANNGMRETKAFDEPESWRFEEQRTYTREQWLDVVPTFGGHNRMPKDTLAEILAAIGTAIDEVTEDGTFTARFITAVATATRSTET